MDPVSVALLKLRILARFMASKWLHTDSELVPSSNMSVQVPVIDERLCTHTAPIFSSSYDFFVFVPARSLFTYF